MKKDKTSPTRYRDITLFSRRRATGQYEADVQLLLLGLDNTPLPERLFVTVQGVAAAGGKFSRREGLGARHAVYEDPGLPAVVVLNAIGPEQGTSENLSA